MPTSSRPARIRRLGRGDRRAAGAESAGSQQGAEMPPATVGSALSHDEASQRWVVAPTSPVAACGWEECQIRVWNSRTDRGADGKDQDDAAGADRGADREHDDAPG